MTALLAWGIFSGQIDETLRFTSLLLSECLTRVLLVKQFRETCIHSCRQPEVREVARQFKVE